VPDGVAIQLTRQRALNPYVSILGPRMLAIYRLAVDAGQCRNHQLKHARALHASSLALVLSFVCAYRHHCVAGFVDMCVDLIAAVETSQPTSIIVAMETLERVAGARAYGVPTAAGMDVAASSASAAAAVAVVADADVADATAALAATSIGGADGAGGAAGDARRTQPRLYAPFAREVCAAMVKLEGVALRLRSLTPVFVHRVQTAADALEICEAGW